MQYDCKVFRLHDACSNEWRYCALFSSEDGCDGPPIDAPNGDVAASIAAERVATNGDVRVTAGEVSYRVLAQGENDHAPRGYDVTLRLCVVDACGLDGNATDILRGPEKWAMPR